MPVETIIDDNAILTESGFYWRIRDGVQMLVCRELETAGFANGFSTRLGGVSPFPENDLNLAGFNEDRRENIYENRSRFLRLFDEPFRIAAVYQVHGDAIKHVANESDITDSDDRADAMISDLNGILLGIKTADCVPIIIGDRATGSFASIHAGWRGTAASIARKTIEQLGSKFGSRPENMIAAIGPAACVRNYEIGDDVMTAFRDNFIHAGEYFTHTRPGHALIDLEKANRDQLIAAGISDQNIFSAPFCTMERTDLFFSYRREKATNGKTGRLLTVIGRAQ